jgi:SAM-dependent methyltransferase
MPMSSTFDCPECLSPLAADLFCGTCGKAAGTVVDGIPCFSDPEFYWGEWPRDVMRGINARAGVVGWEAAVREAVSDRGLLEYVCAPWRADFRHLWEAPRHASVLDVGAGLGGITAALAGNFAEVTAVEKVVERARFIRARTRDVPGVTVVCADFRRLPLARARFDVAVLNGVVEWAGLEGADNPRGEQLRLLRRIRQVLKPGGLACVGIENRIGWAALRGAPDHSGIPYTSLLPRRLAGVVCRINQRRYRSDVNSGGYRTYTYSLAGYRRLFRDAGFGRVRAFHAWDGYNDPRTLLPLEDPSALAWFASHTRVGPLASGWRRAALRAAARTGVWAQFASEYIFLLEAA